MSRYRIIYTDKGATILRNVRKAPTGEPLVLLDKDEVTTVVLDLTAYLEAGETISSVTETEEQRVTASAVLASPLVTITLSNATDYYEGSVTYKFTLSSGVVIRQRIHCRRTNRHTEEEDKRIDYA
jgi:hypothetical protein